MNNIQNCYINTNKQRPMAASIRINHNVPKTTHQLKLTPQMWNRTQICSTDVKVNAI